MIRVKSTQTQRLFDRIESIRLANVTKKYDDRFAVDDLNLEIKGGELLILIGQSGSGKTTTLRMINRLIELDEGHITINGQDIMGFDPVKLRRNIGYVIQNIGLFPHMDIHDNIGLVPKLEGWSEGEISERVENLLDFVALPHETFINRYPRQLSGGQQQRVGLARALAMDPPLLLMDEPFGALDPLLRRQLQDEFVRIKHEIGRTIVFVTHDIDEAFKLGDRIGIMDGGKLVQVGTPEELILAPENELVASIVDADKKFKHMDTLKVRDMLSHLDDKYIFESGMGVDQALDRMAVNNVEIGIVCDGSGLAGQVEMADLLRSRGEGKTLEDIAESSIVFSPHDSVAMALAELKDRGRSVAIVMENERPFGLFFSDEVLLKLI